MTNIPAPLGLLAELTHRCPLACPYCSNPLALDERASELDTASWTRVLHQAAEMGVLQVHLSGGEPASRRDLVEITKAASQAGLYTNLITSGIGLDAVRLERLQDVGLDHVQLSIQDTDPVSSDHIAGYQGAYERKHILAASVIRLGIALTVNAVIHRANIARLPELVDLAASLGAGRVEIAHAQYYGWALLNRNALMPTREQTNRALRQMDDIHARYKGRLVIDMVIPDYYATRPKPCMGGWGRRSLNVIPSGLVLPCHAAQTIPGLVFWSVRDRALADIWAHSPAFEAYRGTGWMKEPCRSCEFREQDFGGCRCQALAIAGDATTADPSCDLSPFHYKMLALAQSSALPDAIPYQYRGRSAATPIAVR